MIDLTALQAFTPEPKPIRAKKSKPVERVYKPGRPRGFMALDAAEQEEIALEKYKTVYRLYLQWWHNYRKTKIPSQHRFAFDEIEALQRKLDYWNRYITSAEGVAKMRQLVSDLKINWRLQ